MSCVKVPMPDGTVVLANMKPGEKLTDADKQAIAEWVQFCRDRREKERSRRKAD